MKDKVQLTDFEKIVLDTVREGINEAIKKRLMDDYSSPLKTLIDDAFRVHSDQIRKILYEALGESLSTTDFKRAVKEAFDHKIARAMIDKMTGSVDRAIDLIKQDPTLKAKMIIAIQNVIIEADHSKLTNP